MTAAASMSGKTRSVTAPGDISDAAPGRSCLSTLTGRTSITFDSSFLNAARSCQGVSQVFRQRTSDVSQKRSSGHARWRCCLSSPTNVTTGSGSDRGICGTLRNVEELRIMASTTILLREDIDELGGRGEIVKVRAGYARNYLLPQGLASLATKGNVKQIEQERSALLKKAAVEKATAEGQKDQMGGIELSYRRQ